MRYKIHLPTWICGFVGGHWLTDRLTGWLADWRTEGLTSTWLICAHLTASNFAFAVCLNACISQIQRQRQIHIDTHWSDLAMAHSCCCQFRCHQNLSEALLMTFANLLASVVVVVGIGIGAFPFPSFMSPVFSSASFFFSLIFFSFAFLPWHFLPTFAFTCDFHDLPPHRIQSRIKNTFILPQTKYIKEKISVSLPFFVCGRCKQLS